ncbi:MAG: Unknown protein [uncultured Thiotrichaceae bacterium]|uniref:Uncharacterized protein n=1 Tax=uncultured Thiotrichaceae bacterium TaxID=298394 RepID=A0A6S6SK93_9GAMM|nr:MAG: Unknown protein [uncultured Thiotrichaceae bacterium]
MEQISISKIQRNLSLLKDFDIIEVVDKKRNKVKGYFIDSKYSAAIFELIEQEKKNKVQAQELAGALHQYANPALIDAE